MHAAFKTFVTTNVPATEWHTVTYVCDDECICHRMTHEDMRLWWRMYFNAEWLMRLWRQLYLSQKDTWWHTSVTSNIPVTEWHMMTYVCGDECICHRMTHGDIRFRPGLHLSHSDTWIRPFMTPNVSVTEWRMFVATNVSVTQWHTMWYVCVDECIWHMMTYVCDDKCICQIMTHDDVSLWRRMYQTHTSSCMTHDDVCVWQRMCLTENDTWWRMFMATKVSVTELHMMS